MSRNVFVRLDGAKSIPVCNNGKLLRKLTGKESFSESDIHLIVELGFTIRRAKK